MTLTLSTCVQETWHWLTSTFAPEICDSREERAVRLLEEALELAQAAGVSLPAAHALVGAVYAKPVGTVEDEAGDVFNTLLALCGRYNLDLEHLHRKTLTRNWEIAQKIDDRWQHKAVVAKDLQRLQVKRRHDAMASIGRHGIFPDQDNMNGLE